MLKINNLSKYYDDEKVIENLNLTVEKGEKICLFAPSGAGKTTLLRLIKGLDNNYEGSIKTYFDNISIVFQEPNLLWYKNIKENIFLPFDLNNREVDGDTYNKYRNWLKVTDLINKEKYRPNELSGGMKKRASLIRGFLYPFDCILLDEPFSSIDIKMKNHIVDFIFDEYGDRTFIFVTHNIQDIPKIADRLLIFEDDYLGNFKEKDVSSYKDPSILAKEIYKVIS